MTSIHKSRLSNQASLSASPSGNLVAKGLCAVVGLTCVAGFALDMLVLSAPPDPFAIEWRVSFLQQAGDRSIILLFGAALLLYSKIDNRRLSRTLSLLALGIGVALMLSSMLVIRDNLILQKQALDNINAQSEQIQTQIDDNRTSLELPQEVTPEQLDRAVQQIASQTQELKQSAKNNITRSGLASLGNLLVVGMGFVSLGRLGLTKIRQMSRN